MTCVTKCIEPLFSGASKSWPILGRTHALPPSSFSQSSNATNRIFLPSLPFSSFSFPFLSFFSLFFPPLPFSPLCASLTHGSVGKKRRIATGTMRRNWKSPDAENWPFPMIPWIYRALTRERGLEIPSGIFYFGPLSSSLLLLLLYLPPLTFIDYPRNYDFYDRAFDFSFLEILRFFVGRIFLSLKIAR